MVKYVAVDKEWLEAGLTDVSDSIREILETEEKLEFPQGMKEAIESYSLDEPLEAQDALIEQIKTALQGKASGGEDYSKYSYVSRFYNLNLFDKKEITINADYLEEATLMFTQRVEKNTTVEHIVVNISSYFKTCAQMFFAPEKDSTLKRITLNLDFSNCNSFSAMFNGLTALEIIDGNHLDISKSTNNGAAFSGNYALKEVRFVPLCINKQISFYHSSQLSDVSIQSIIDGLADLTGTTSQTLTLHVDVKAKLTEDQITAITSKNWTLA